MATWLATLAFFVAMQSVNLTDLIQKTQISRKIVVNFEDFKFIYYERRPTTEFLVRYSFL